MIKINDDSWHYRLYSKYGLGRHIGEPKTLCAYLSNVFLGFVMAGIVAALISGFLIFAAEGLAVMIISHVTPIDVLLQNFFETELQPFFFPDASLGFLSIILWTVVFLILSVRWTVRSVVWVARNLLRLERAIAERLNLPRIKFKFPEMSFLSLLSQRLKDFRDNVCTPVKVIHKPEETE